MVINLTMDYRDREIEEGWMEGGMDGWRDGWMEGGRAVLKLTLH